MELSKSLLLIRDVPQGKTFVGYVGKSGEGALPAGNGES